jgi:hypothetical protein
VSITMGDHRLYLRKSLSLAKRRRIGELQEDIVVVDYHLNNLSHKSDQRASSALRRLRTLLECSVAYLERT